MFRSYTKCRGFTLVEMLVVISIIGILMSLLVPAAMRAREQGRIVQCANNLKQLGLAMLNYETTFKTYPLNWGWASDTGDASTTVGHSWIALLLPQLDMMPAYQRIKMGAPLNAYPSNAASAGAADYDNSAVARVALPFLRCPSDIGDGTALTSNVDNSAGQKLVPRESGGQGEASDVGVTNYKACCGSNYPYSQKWPANDPSTGGGIRRGRNLSKISSYNGRDYCNGIMCRGYNASCNTSNTSEQNKKVEVYFPTDSGNIVDGASYTIAIGEAVPSVSQWSAWYWWNGVTASTGIFASAPTAGSAYSSPLNYALNYSRSTSSAKLTERNTYGFNSRHGGMIQFVMCDGAVHPLTEGIDLKVLNRLAAIDDREMIDNRALGW